MKRYLSVILLILILSYPLSAQNSISGPGCLPVKSCESPAFGKDIIMNDQPSQNQYSVAVSSAFNGWLFAVVVHETSLMKFTFLKSVDQGITWTIIKDGLSGETNVKLTSNDLVVIGDSISNLKIVWALDFVQISNPELFGFACVKIFDASTGEFLDQIFHDPFCYSIALASDYLYPASNSNPHSMGILYSIYRSYGDSVIFQSSSNGGLSFDGYKGVAGSLPGHFHKVALSYGKSASWPSGRYFAAWEEQSGFGNSPGQIFTAHTNPDFNSPFTSPVNVDGIDPAFSNLCQNPTIACQNSASDNDSLNLTEVIMYEKYNTLSNRFDIGGCYNLQATSSSYFKPLSVTNQEHVNIQPDLEFNPYDSTFMLTYYDTTTKSLPFLKTNLNIPNPYSWTLVDQGYNESKIISNPQPQLKFNMGQPESMIVWISDRPAGNSMAMFDSPESVYTGIPVTPNTPENISIKAFPNPCDKILNIDFSLNHSDIVKVKLYDIMGRERAIITNRLYTEGKHREEYNLTNLPAGIYFYSANIGNHSYSGKVLIIH